MLNQVVNHFLKKKKKRLLEIIGTVQHNIKIFKNMNEQKKNNTNIMVGFNQNKTLCNVY